MRRPRIGLALGLVLLLGATGCADGGAADASSGGTEEGGTGTVTVFAAASLTEAFGRIAAEFRAEHPGVDVRFSFAGSSALAQQVVSGAPADVFAAASPATMAVVTDAGLAAGKPVVFARNRLQIAVPPGNPGRVRRLDDFARPELTLALCAPQVPCGAAAEKLLAAAGVTAAPDTLEQDVKAALSKVRLGEVDAALVYRTDVIAAGDAVEGVPVPEAVEAVNDYPIAVLAEAPNPGAAEAFVAYVRSDNGQRALADAGFDRP